MLLHDKFIALIETHAELLTRNWIREVKNNPLTPGYKNLSEDDLHFKVFDVYRRLSAWLPQEETVFREIAEHYMKLGRARAHEGVKLSEVLYATSLSKVELWKYIRSQGIINDAIDMYRALEFFRRIDSFYDRMIYFISTGYESAHMDEHEIFKKSGFFDKVADSFAHWFVKDIK